MAFGFFKKKKKQDKVEPLGNAQNNHYYQLKVKDVIQETSDAVSIVFEMPSPAIQYKAGQFLTLIQQIEGNEVRRSYSFCSAPEIDNDIAVTIKRVEGGLMSNYLADHIKSGDEMKVMEPLGRFTVAPSDSGKQHLVMFAGGSGITPMMSILKKTLTDEEGSAVSLIYANRHKDAIIFDAYLKELQDTFSGRLNVIHILEKAENGWDGYEGLLNEDILNRIMASLPDFNVNETTYLLCGPEGMMVNAHELLLKKGVSEDRIMKESFTSSHKNESDQPQVSGDKKVIIHYEGSQYTLQVPPGKSILETALDENIDLPFSCQSGLCTACRGKLRSGQINMEEEEGLTPQEREQGYVLTCVGHPLSDDVEIDIG